ncbi:MAG: sugar porter family MFS transporter [bacterium]|nr:sugar porter family MFS transporter [bacterium]
METETNYNMKYIWMISLVAAMGGLLFGYDWVVIGGAKPFFQPFFGLETVAIKGWANSCALVGCLLGALISGSLSDKYGRKRLLILSGFLFTVSAIGTGLVNNFNWFVIYRIIGGVGIGLASSLSPMFIAEVAPAHLRGRFVSINQLTIVIGVLAAQIINWLISLSHEIPDNATTTMILESWNGQYGWRWMFGAETVLALLFFVLMFFVPESPRWLIKNGQDSLAERIMAKIGGEIYAKAELVDIKNTLSTEEIAHVNFKDLLEPKMTKILMIGIVLAVFQQWCGINVIFNYAEDIFEAAGYDIKGIMLNIVITGSVMLVFTFIAIGTVDKFGRKILMLIGAAGLACTYAIIGYSFYTGVTGFKIVLLTIMAIGFYSFSLAPITWVLLSEIFPNRIRGAAMSVSVSALWIGCLTLTYTFPWLRSTIGPANLFWLYGLICAVGFIFILCFLPETKGKSLEQIEAELVD